jgi:hypothetical protein
MIAHAIDLWSDHEIATAITAPNLMPVEAGRQRVLRAHGFARRHPQGNPRRDAQDHRLRGDPVGADDSVLDTVSTSHLSACSCSGPSLQAAEASLPPDTGAPRPAPGITRREQSDEITQADDKGAAESRSGACSCQARPFSPVTFSWGAARGTASATRPAAARRTLRVRCPSSSDLWG